MAILPGFIPPLFETETNPLRFERVCIALYRASEGVTIVPTSYNYDQGRDGRTINHDSIKISGILCATLSTGLEDKVRGDVKRLLETTKTNSIIYCTARKLTEDGCDKVEELIRTEYPQLAAVRVLSQVQLVALAQNHEDVLLEHYPGEILNLQQTLIVGNSDTAALEGLRLALATSAAETATELRTTLLERLVLGLLAEEGASSINAISTKLGGQLHLPRAPSSGYVRQALEQLHSTLAVTSNGDKWEITDIGRVRIRPSEVPAQRLLEGRTLIRAALSELTGKPITDSMFNQFWDRFQAAIADAFYEHGLNVIQSIRGIIEGDDPESKNTFRQLIEGVATRTTGGFTNAEQREEISQAVVDIFSEPGQPAFDWLAEICSVYVMLCSLGLEARSARQISDTLKSLTLVPDSDIVLSLLCEGERNHVAVEHILRGWQALAGSVQVATPVLIEMAHHAWIARQDYDGTHHLFHKLNDLDAERVIVNAFVRSYWRMSRGRANSGHWQAYIRDYRGASETDYSRIFRILNEEYHIELLPEYIEPSSKLTPKSFEAVLSEFMRSRLANDFGVPIDELDYRTIDKARRDAQFLANVCEARRTSASVPFGKVPVVVSSARVLRQAALRFTSDFGEPEVVIPLPAVAALLAITPGVQLGLGSLRAVLFDVGLSRRLVPLQRLAYRVIKASDLYAFPYSRRGTLRRRLTEQVLKNARNRVKSPAHVENELLDPANEEVVARTVLTVLDKMAIQPRVGRVMQQQQAEIEILQAEIRRLRTAQAGSSNSPPTSFTAEPPPD
jgi:hypothetical protein